MKIYFHIAYNSCCSFVKNFIFFLFKITYFHCAPSYEITTFFNAIFMYTSCLFSILLNEDIVDIEKPDRICLLSFVLDEFSGLFLHPLIFSIIHSKST